MSIESKPATPRFAFGDKASVSIYYTGPNGNRAGVVVESQVRENGVFYRLLFSDGCSDWFHWTMVVTSEMGPDPTPYAELIAAAEAVLAATANPSVTLKATRPKNNGSGKEKTGAMSDTNCKKPSLSAKETKMNSSDVVVAIVIVCITAYLIVDAFCVYKLKLAQVKAKEDANDSD